MADQAREEELLRSIDKVDARLKEFRKRVRALLAEIEARRARDMETTGEAAAG